MTRHAGAGWYTSRRYAATRRSVFARAGWRCQSCGSSARLECDHVVPLDQGGAAWNPENLQALCRECHARKSAAEHPARRPTDAEWEALLESI